MTTLDPVIAAQVDAFRTCEFSTVTADGTPVGWPVAMHRRPDGTLLVTSALGFPQKAQNVRRDGRVSLLFSDPTGSGLDTDRQIQITGTATCAQEIAAGPEGLESYWSMLFQRQPGSRRYLDPPARRLMDWYFLRLLIVVTPQQICTRARIPAPLPPDDAAPARSTPDGPTPLGARLLAEFDTVVLVARDTDGAPVGLRTRAIPAATDYTLTVPGDAVVEPGPASLLVHSHDEQLARLRSGLIRGELAQDAEGWRFTPHRLVQPAASSTPWQQLQTLRLARARAARYLERRGLSRPRVRWDLYRAVAAASSSR